MAQLNNLSKARLGSMVEAGERILECYRVLRKTGDNVVGEVLRGQGEFFEMDHYPKGDAYDPETHSQYYYHSHRDDEHGHFHTFLRENGMPKGVAPIEQSEAPFMGERDDTLSHLIAISMNRAGYPIRLFTTNRWVGAEHWYEAEDVITMLDSFMMDMAQPSWPVNIWITNLVRLFHPEIEELVRERDKVVADWRTRHQDRDVFEDRELEITSNLDISVEKQIKRVKKAQMTSRS